MSPILMFSEYFTQVHLPAAVQRIFHCQYSNSVLLVLPFKFWTFWCMPRDCCRRLQNYGAL